MRLVTLCLAVLALMSFTKPAVSECRPKSTLVSASKTVKTIMKGDKAIHKVSVKITKEQLVQGFAKYEDVIPEGYAVSNLRASFGKAEIINNRIRVIYLDVNQVNDLTITYLISGSKTKPVIDGRFSFLNQEQEKNCLAVTNF